MIHFTNWYAACATVVIRIDFGFSEEYSRINEVWFIFQQFRGKKKKVCTV